MKPTPQAVAMAIHTFNQLPQLASQARPMLLTDRTTNTPRAVVSIDRVGLNSFNTPAEKQFTKVHSVQLLPGKATFTQPSARLLNQPVAAFLTELV
jgi:hypothetical protein